jgi:polyhydroxybutyrate depolymerase
MTRRRIVRAGAVGLVLGIAGCSSAHSDSESTPVTTATAAVTSPTAAPATIGAAGAIPSAGCRAPTTPSVSNKSFHIEVGGLKRDYLLTTPPAHQRADPLVVDFHGYSEGAPTEALATQFSPLAQRDGFLVAYPDGRGTPIAWNTSTRANNPDLHFVTALLDHLEATQCVDEARVYATGLSQGAFMSSTMACAMSDRFAAVAPVAGLELPAPCPTSRPVPILTFHGTADPILHFNGGLGKAVLQDDVTVDPKPLPKLPKARLNGPGYPAHVREWAAKDGCSPTPTDTKPSAHVIHRAYRCPPGVAVEFDIILGGGHTWPGSAFDNEIRKFVGHTTMEINATTTIWTFFQRFHLTSAPS